MIAISHLENKVESGETSWRALDENSADALAGAIRDLREACSLGHAGALYELGLILEKGLLLGKANYVGAFDL